MGRQRIELAFRVEVEAAPLRDDVTQGIIADIGSKISRELEMIFIREPGGVFSAQYRVVTVSGEIIPDPSGETAP